MLSLTVEVIMFSLLNEYKFAGCRAWMLCSAERRGTAVQSQSVGSTSMLVTGIFIFISHLMKSCGGAEKREERMGLLKAGSSVI